MDSCKNISLSSSYDINGTQKLEKSNNLHNKILLLTSYGINETKK
jgi:hypothetical protein